MLLSILTISWLLATSTSAVPVKHKGGDGLRPVDGNTTITPDLTPELIHRLCLQLEGQRAQEEEIQACKVLLADEESLQIRDLKKGTWNTSERTKLEAAAEKDATLQRLLDTVSTLGKNLDANKIPWSVSGGLALKLYGQDRNTTDIDMEVQTDISKLKALLAKDKAFIGPEVTRPNARHLTVFYNQGTEAKPTYIELDLVISGLHETPADLVANSINIQQKTSDGKPLSVHVMRLGVIFQSKVWALANPSRNKDDKDIADLSWIIKEHPEALKNVEAELPLQQRQLVITNLEKRKSPLVETARKLLKVNSVSTAPAGKQPTKTAPAGKRPTKN